MFTIHDRLWPHRPFDLLSVPRANKDDVRVLWVDAYWDGPLSGVCQYAGETLWFQHYFDRDFDEQPSDHDESDSEERDPPVPAVLSQLGLHSPYHRVLLLYRISQEQLAEERRWNALFVEHVGGHHDFTVDESERSVRSRDTRDRFYERYQRERPTMDLSAAPVVAVWVL